MSAAISTFQTFVAVDIARSEIKNAIYNPRKISKDARAKLEASLKEFGLVEPFVWNKRTGNLVGGHQRLRELDSLMAVRFAEEAAGENAELRLNIPEVKRDPMAYTVTVAAVDLPLEKEKALNIALNARGAQGEYDRDLLATLLADIGDDNFDVSDLLDKSEKKLLRLLSGERNETKIDAEAQIDKAAELAKKWGVELGQIWQLGDHRLSCGDSTDVKSVAGLLDSDRPLLMVTDPPYGVKYSPAWRSEALADGAQRAEGEVTNDDKAFWLDAFKLFGGNVAYVWHAHKYASLIQACLETLDFEIRSQIIWAKSALVLSRGDYHWQHEPCWYCVRKGRSARWTGDRSQSTLWEIPHRKSGTGHGTQKPIECMARAIRNNSEPDDCVYEPFLGSGTTLIACERLGRKCRAMEISPGYVAVSLQRWADATGGAPELVAA